ncbi:MAG: hypothetical protein LBG42_02380, partial [Treponema sp.]|nr:hypothetical protein [Treponema sp.]
VVRNHECTGADCPVCVLIRQAENFSRQPRNIPFFPGFQGAAFLATAFILKRSFLLFILQSAVRLKVKMNR